MFLKKLGRYNSEDFLKKVCYLEGGNIEKINIVFSDTAYNDSCSYVDIYAYPEGRPNLCHMRLNDLNFFKLDASVGVHIFFGLSGYPNSLDIAWTESSVVIAIGANVSDTNVEALKQSDCWFEGRSLEVIVEP